MNVKSLVILCLVGVKFLSAAGGEVVSTDVVYQQAMSEGAGNKKTFKTVMAAANRYGEAQIFAGLIRRCGLQYGLNNYGGKKNPRGKRITKFLKLLPQGQKITLLVPISENLLPTINKIRAAEDAGDKVALKAALADALKVIQDHIIKGEFTKATLKGQMETLGGTKINADNLQFFKADVQAGNGVLHIIKHLSTYVAPAAEPVVDAAPALAVDKPADKPAEAAKTVDKPVEAAKPAETPAVAVEVAKPVAATVAAPAKPAETPVVAKPVEAPVVTPAVKEEAKPAVAAVDAAKPAEVAK